MTNCKHGNGPDCLECQYEADEKLVKGTGHEAWELWEWKLKQTADYMFSPCNARLNPSKPSTISVYRRRHDAYEMIKELGQKKHEQYDSLLEELATKYLSGNISECVENLQTAIDALKSDKCATCRLRQAAIDLKAYLESGACIVQGFDIPDEIYKQFDNAVKNYEKKEG